MEDAPCVRTQCVYTPVVHARDCLSYAANDPQLLDTSASACIFFLSLLRLRLLLCLFFLFLRMMSAATAADEYLDLCPVSPSVVHIRLLVKYLLGSCLSIFILLYLFDETPLLFIKVLDRNLLWYTIVLGVLYAGIRDTPSSSSANGRSSLQHIDHTGLRGGAFDTHGGGKPKPKLLQNLCTYTCIYSW